MTPHTSRHWRPSSFHPATNQRPRDGNQTNIENTTFSQVTSLSPATVSTNSNALSPQLERNHAEREALSQKEEEGVEGHRYFEDEPHISRYKRAAKEDKRGKKKGWWKRNWKKVQKFGKKHLDGVLQRLSDRSRGV